MDEIGLKGFRKRYQGCSLKYKIKRLYHELRYAWQRVWKGYDDVDVFDCSFRFAARMIPILEDYKKNYKSVWLVPYESEYYEQLGNYDECYSRRIFNKEETDTIIDMIIWHLKMSDNDFAEKWIFGTNVYDDKWETGCRSGKDYKRINDVVKQNKDAFMKLFSLFYFDLWD